MTATHTVPAALEVAQLHPDAPTSARTSATASICRRPPTLSNPSAKTEYSKRSAPSGPQTARSSSATASAAPLPPEKPAWPASLS
ncbi:hypothetical protein [Rhodococcus sp. JT-3]|uniref:hypothetical protein n=1 Tax=Rhodococcus sp. JT-3 TaxID=1973213 RepID=UPI003FA3B156